MTPGLTSGVTALGATVRRCGHDAVAASGILAADKCLLRCRQSFFHGRETYLKADIIGIKRLPSDKSGYSSFPG